MQTQLTKTQKESGDYYKGIWNLDLFQTYEVDKNTDIIRVPGGWICRTATFILSSSGDYRQITETFLPYSEEFKPLTQ